MTPEKLDELRRLHEEATPRPWQLEDPLGVSDDASFVTTGSGPSDFVQASTPEDNRLIAAMRNALPDLLEENEKLKDAIRRGQEASKVRQQLVSEQRDEIDQLRDKVERLQAELTDMRALYGAAVQQMVEEGLDRVDLVAPTLPCGHPASCVRPQGGHEGTTRYCGWCADVEGALWEGQDEGERRWDGCVGSADPG